MRKFWENLFSYQIEFQYENMHLNKKSPSIFNKVIDEIEEKIFDLDEHIKLVRFS